MPRDDLRIGLEGFPKNFDPRQASDIYSFNLIETLYNGLVKPSAGGQYEPDLAEKIEPEGANRYRVTLRPHVRFHHGEELTSADVQCTYESVLDPATGSPARTSFEPIRKIEILSALELRLVLDRPYAPIFEALTQPVLPCDLLKRGHDFRAEPVGTGFLRLLRKEPPSYVELEPFPNYFAGASKLPRRVRFTASPNATTRVLALLHGDLDLAVNNVSALYVDYLRKKGGLDILTGPGTRFTYMGFNLRDPVTGNLLVRRAIAHAVGREALVRYRLRGTADLAHALLPASHWAGLADGPRYEFSPEKAEALLDEAGFPKPPGGGPRLRLQYKTSQNKDALRNIEVIRENLSRVGIAVNVQPYEWGTYFEQIKRGDFQLYSLSWVGVADPDFYYNVFHSRETPESGGRNRGRYASAEVDALLERGRAELDPARRAGIYRELQRILARDLPYLPLWHDRNVAIVGVRVRGYALDERGSFRALWAVSVSAGEAGP